MEKCISLFITIKHWRCEEPSFSHGCSSRSLLSPVKDFSMAPFLKVYSKKNPLSSLPSSKIFPDFWKNSFPIAISPRESRIALICVARKITKSSQIISHNFSAAAWSFSPFFLNHHPSIVTGDGDHHHITPNISIKAKKSRRVPNAWLSHGRLKWRKNGRRQKRLMDWIIGYLSPPPRSRLAPLYSAAPTDNGGRTIHRNMCRWTIIAMTNVHGLHCFFHGDNSGLCHELLVDGVNKALKGRSDS